MTTETESSITINRKLLNLLGEQANERFRVTYIPNHKGEVRQYSDNIVGLMGYILSTDEIVMVEKYV